MEIQKLLFYGIPINSGSGFPFYFFYIMFVVLIHNLILPGYKSLSNNKQRSFKFSKHSSIYAAFRNTTWPYQRSKSKILLFIMSEIIYAFFVRIFIPSDIDGHEYFYNKI